MKHLSSGYRLKINKVLVIAFLWIIFGGLITLYDHFLFHSRISAGTSADYSFLKSLFINSAAGFAGAVIAGSFLVFYVNVKFRDKPYWMTIALVAASLIAVFFLVSLVLALIISPLQTGKPLGHPETRQAFINFFFDQLFLKNLLAWSFIIAFTQLMLQVNDKFGQGILWHFIRGRYYNPREETRIFMMVDIISSTAIAEKIGNEKYHHLLRDFYADITNAVINNKGEIYQYVGDEIVISWKLEGNMQNNRCLKCYFDMFKEMNEVKDKYETKYGLVPGFKAGLHYGKVIAGEIGIIKRDITFSGDVLNTTSRIQNKCNEYNVKILSSDELLRMLCYDDLYRRVSIGDIELKGKGGKVALSTLEIRSI